MKTKKHILIISLVLAGFISTPAIAQEERGERNHNRTYYDNDDEENTLSPVKYVVPTNGVQIKKVVIKDLLAEIKIVGSQGKDIVIDVEGLEGIPEKAKGLKPLYGSGCMDNTGAGVAANESGGVLTICGASKGSEDAHYVITIPKGISLRIDYNSPFANEDLEIKDVEGEVEVSTLNSDINCINVTGPLVLNSISGDIDVKISNLNQNSPTSISLISGDLDITMPTNTTANLEMGSISGGIYTDFDLKSDSKKGNLPRVGGNNFETKLNGGGVELNLNNTSGNIYLRKK